MQVEPEKSSESEEILEYRFASEDTAESDFSYSEAVMDEALTHLLNERSGFRR
jgi:hypothetical protein